MPDKKNKIVYSKKKSLVSNFDQPNYYNAKPLALDVPHY